MNYQSPDDVIASAVQLDREGNFIEQRDLLDAAIKRWPESVDVLFHRARVLRILGNTPEAIQTFESVLSLDSTHAPTIFALIAMGAGEIAGGLKKLQEIELSAVGTPTGKVSFHYAKARLLEDGGRDSEAFDEYTLANAADASMGGMGTGRLIKGAKAVIKDIQPDYLGLFSGRGHSSERPVFIVGVPRSGTSLTEQFLTAHPQVAGAGETQHWPAMMANLVKRASPPVGTMIESINSLDADVWRQAGNFYLSQFDPQPSEIVRVTDKLPGNFGLLPYILLIFPRARIIHVRRDPMATLYSCIKQHFRQPQLAFSIEGWARYYGVYQALMETWEPIIGHQMLTIDYEELVGNFSSLARKVVDFVGLEWNDACLYPEKNTRAVTTASVDQVRSPVNSSSLHKWRRHQASLEALLPVIKQTRDEVRQGF